MKNIPTLFNFPLWDGNIKRRVAKKYLNRWCIGKRFKLFSTKFATLGVGDLVNDCSGFNGEIRQVNPEYFPVRGGFILRNVNIITTNTGCSLIHCGVEPELSREDVEARHLDTIENWTLGKGGETWYGGFDNPEFQDVFAMARRKRDVIRSGSHITDDRGRLLPEFKTHK